MDRFGVYGALGVGFACAALGCGQILGLGDFEDAPTNGGEGGAASSSDVSSTSTSASTGGGEGGASCADGATQPCYSGPEGTEGQGLCVAGEQACKEGAWGACEGEVLPGAEDCATPTSEDCVANCGEHVWSRAFGPVELPIVADIAMNGAGASVVVGTFAGVMSFGCQAIQASSSSSTFVSVFDGSGACVWTRAWLGDAFPLAVAIDDGGSVVVAATAATLVDLGDGHTAAPGSFVVRLQADGKPSWEHGYTAFPSDVAFDPVGNVLVVGSFSGMTTIGPTGVSSQGGTDGFLQKMDSSGQHAFALQFGSPSDDVGAVVESDSSGSIYVGGLGGPGTAVGGVTLPAASPFAARFTSLGNLTWAVGGAGTNRVAGIVPDGTGGAFLGGTFSVNTQLGSTSLTSAGANDGVILHIDPAGLVQWAKQFGSDGDDVVGELGLNANGDLVASGTFAGTVDFGGVPLIAAGTVDAFLVALDPSGSHIWSRSISVLQAQVTIDPVADSALILGEFNGTVDLGGGLLGVGGENLLLANLAARHPSR